MIEGLLMPMGFGAVIGLILIFVGEMIRRRNIAKKKIIIEEKDGYTMTINNLDDKYVWIDEIAEQLKESDTIVIEKSPYVRGQRAKLKPIDDVDCYIYDGNHNLVMAIHGKVDNDTEKDG